jgi:hypothetical protein
MPALLRPASTQIDLWQLAPVHEERFDVPDEPMAGDMDARFFLSKHKNYIPHEYPCRRIFAERFRGRRPVPVTAFAQAGGADGWWFPFGADRVDLSGFWYRPTRVETWAMTRIVAETAGPRTLRLTTCGAAILTIDGAEAGWMAPCMRNLDTAAEFTVDLSAGEHEIRVWLGDLCERDTRWWFRLEVADGAPVRTALPVPIEAERVETVLAVLDGMRFDRVAYPDGAVTILLDRAPAWTLGVEIRVEGHFMAADRKAVTRTLAPGAVAIPVAAVAELPADFRYFKVRLTDGPVTIGRPLGVEVVDAAAQGVAPDMLAARVAETLAHVAKDSEADPAGAVARLALGLTGAETDRRIAEVVPAIADCVDCADFVLVPLLWARMQWPDGMSPDLRAQVDDAILGFRYWLDEPGNDVMWFYSENHALLFHTCCYLAGTLFPDATFRRSGRTGRGQQAVGRERLHKWLDHFEACEMAEWNSAPYFPIDLKGLCALFALAPDADIRARAEKVILRLFEVIALACHQGLLAASQGRSYEHTLRAARTLELSSIARMLWGRGWYGRKVEALPLVALAIRDHGLVPPPELSAIARWQDARELEWTFSQGEGRFAPLYHAKARDWAMGTLAGYRHYGWGYQETVLHLRLGDHPDAQVWINHPGERILSGYARPSYWGGCGTLPRVHQYRGLAFLQMDCDPETPDFTHAYVPTEIMDETIVEERRVLVRSGSGLAIVQASGPLHRVDRGPTAGFDWQLPGRRGTWIVRLSTLEREGSLADFGRRMAGLAVRTEGDGRMLVEDPDYGKVVGEASGTIEAEGRRLDPAQWTQTGAARTSDGTPLVLPSQRAAGQG